MDAFILMLSLLFVKIHTVGVIGPRYINTHPLYLTQTLEQFLFDFFITSMDCHVFWPGVYDLYVTVWRIFPGQVRTIEKERISEKVVAVSGLIDFLHQRLQTNER